MTPIQQWLIDNGINYLCDDLVQLMQENPVTTIVSLMTMYQQWQIHGLNLDLTDAREQIVAIRDTALAIEDANDDADTTVPAIEDASSEQSDTINSENKQGKKRKITDGDEPEYHLNKKNDGDDKDGNGSAPGKGGSTGPSSSSKVLEMVLEIEGSSNRGSSSKKARTGSKGKYRNKSNSNDDDADADINDLLESLDNLDNNIDSTGNYDSYFVAGLVSIAAMSLVSADISPVIDTLSSCAGEVSGNLLDSMPDLLF